eukprot:631250-Prorocentrum_minimum.AAC.7
MQAPSPNLHIRTAPWSQPEQARAPSVLTAKHCKRPATEKCAGKALKNALVQTGGIPTYIGELDAVHKINDESGFRIHQSHLLSPLPPAKASETYKPAKI